MSGCSCFPAWYLDDEVCNGSRSAMLRAGPFFGHPHQVGEM